MILVKIMFHLTKHVCETFVGAEMSFFLLGLQAGHFVFIDNPSAFHSAIFHACRKFLSPGEDQSLPDPLTTA